MSLVIGQMLQNRYRVDALLGQGGFGAVYRVHDLNLNKPVAVKENLDATPEAQRQFTHEVQILSALRHPNLPSVSDYFFIPGQGQYLVMDFIEGEDLQSMLERGARPDEARAVNWLTQVCDALAYLHTQTPPIIHRDIKPANIKIMPQGKAVLVDFGLSKVYDPHLKTTIGARAVTPGFSPWEQYGQGTTDARSDVYALGATLYVLLTGETPPESIALVGGAAQLIPPRTLNPNISPSVESAIQRAMSTQTTSRFADAGQLRVALNTRPTVMPTQRIVEPVPIAQPAPSSTRSNTSLVFAMVVAAALLVVLALAAAARQPAAASLPDTPVSRPTDLPPTVAPAAPAQASAASPTVVVLPNETPTRKPTVTPMPRDTATSEPIMTASPEPSLTATSKPRPTVVPRQANTAVPPRPAATLVQAPPSSQPLNFSWYAGAICQGTQQQQVTLNVTAHGGTPPYDYYNDTTLIGLNIPGSVDYSLVTALGNQIPFKLIVVDSVGQRYAEDIFYKSGLKCTN